MPVTKFPFMPGIYKDDTPSKAEGYAVDGNWIRWWNDAWQAMGGSELATTATFSGVARGGHAWADLSGTKAAAFGTAADLYAYYGGDILTITPEKARGTLVNPFTTQNGSPVVVVFSLNHGLKDGDTVTFSNADAVGAITVNGPYAVDEILSPSLYRIVTGTTASSDATGGGSVEYSVLLDAGLVDGIGGLGYGSGAYGTGLYGISTTGDIHARVWSLDNWGNNLLALPTNGALYEWQPAVVYPELVVNGSFADTSAWFSNIVTLVDPFTTTTGDATVTVTHASHGLTTGNKVTFRGGNMVGGVRIAGEKTVTVTNTNTYTVEAESNATSTVTTPAGGTVEVTMPSSGSGSSGWSITGGKLTATAGKRSSAYQDMTGRLSGGVTYVIEFDAVVTAGGLQVRVTNAASDSPFPVAFGETIRKTAHYKRRFTAPPNPTFFQFAKDDTFAGSIDNVSIKMEDEAYRIMDAPQYARDMFVDPNRFVVLLGTVEQDGDFNAMCVRWCDQENNRTWTANDDNQAGEFALALGSEIRGGLAARGQNLVWTDSALYSMRYSGSSQDVFRFDLIGQNCGLIHKNAAVEHNGIAFWWSANGNFYIYTGGVAQILPCHLLKDVMENLASGQESKISCGVNAAKNEIWFQYPDKRDGNECSRYVTYNWSAQCFYSGKLNRTQWIADGIFPSPLTFSPDGKIYFQERGNSDNGDVLSWEWVSGDLDLGEGDYLMKATRLIPDFQDQKGLIKFWLTFKAFPTDPGTTYGPYECRTDTRKIDFRHTGRLMSLRIVGEGAPSYARFGAVKMDLAPTSSIR